MESHALAMQINFYIGSRITSTDKEYRAAVCCPPGWVKKMYRLDFIQKKADTAQYTFSLHVFSIKHACHLGFFSFEIIIKQDSWWCCCRASGILMYNLRSSNAGNK
jgi:hypothetical protein